MKLLLLLLLFISIDFQELSSFNKHSVVYVSSSLGIDSNNGMSEITPVRRLSKALSMSDTILLKAGDIFFGSIDFRGKYVTRYGKGSNPIICGFKRIVTPSWKKVEDNIWKIDLRANNYSGVANVNYKINNVGCIYDYTLDKVYGRKVQFKNELSENWDFWQTNDFARDAITENSFNELFLYLNEDPNRFNLEFSTGTIGVNIGDGKMCHIDVVGFGVHGIVGGSNTSISNCRVDIIGGSIHIGYKNYVCLGNGIEFYVSKNISNCVVEHCEISRCFDSGVTIQGSGYLKAAPKNIIIRNCYIHDCCQGWEDFLRNGDNDFFNNCILYHNLLANNGMRTTFGYDKKRFKYCHVLGNNLKGDRGMIIRENIFINGNYYCSGAFNEKYKSNKWLKNKCYIQRGQFILSNYMGTKNVIRIPIEKGKFRNLQRATDNAISRYRELTGDETTRFIIISEDEIARIISKHRKKLVK